MRCYASIDSWPERLQCSRRADATTEFYYPLCGQHRRMFERIFGHVPSYTPKKGKGD